MRDSLGELTLTFSLWHQCVHWTEMWPHLAVTAVTPDPVKICLFCSKQHSKIKYDG